MFRLELGVLVGDVLVEGLDEEVVDFLRQANLGHLKFCQVVRQHGVVEVLQLIVLK